MTWKAPDVLWLLLGIPFLVGLLGWAIRVRQRALLRFAEERLLPALTPQVRQRQFILRGLLVILGLFFLLLSLAGPQWGFHWQETRRHGVDIVVALDTSRSMLATDVAPTRLDRAKLGVRGLVERLTGDRIGLVAFAGTAFLQCPLTLDYTAFLESLHSVTVGIIPKGGTSVSQALDVGRSAFEYHTSPNKVLIIITDGEDHDGEVERASQRAAAAGIAVYAVGVGTQEGEIISVETASGKTYLKDREGRVVKSRLGTETLQNIALTTGGAYVYDTGPTLGLEQAYDRYVSGLDKSDLRTTVERRDADRFQYPLAIAVLFFVLEWFVGRHASRAEIT